MAKNDNNILLIGGLAIAAFFLLNKKKSNPSTTSVVHPGVSRNQPVSNSYGYSQNPGNLITSAGSAVSDIINAIKGKNTAVIQPAPQGFDYQQWSETVSQPQISEQQAPQPDYQDQQTEQSNYWDQQYGDNYENYA